MCFSFDEESRASLEAVKLRLFAYSFQRLQQLEGREILGDAFVWTKRMPSNSRSSHGP